MSASRRQQWCAGRALLAETLCLFTGCEMLPAMQVSVQGKPSFVETSLPHFSLSHSGNSLQLLVCTAGEAGCDVEQFRPRPHYLSVAQEAFSQTEFQWLVEQPEPQTAFWQLWCLREAWLKQQGGSVWQMDRISLDPRVRRFTSQPPTDSQLWFAADETVASALALPAGVSAPEEFAFDAVSCTLVPQISRRWLHYSPG